MINFEYLFVHVAIVPFVISSVSAQPNCTEIARPKNPTPNDTIGKGKDAYQRYALNEFINY